jgi:hypothetical protein
MYFQILISAPWKSLEGFVMTFPRNGGFHEIYSVDENAEDQGS